MSREIELRDGQGVGYMRKNDSGEIEVIPAELEIEEGQIVGVDFGGTGTILNGRVSIQLALPELENHILEEVNTKREVFYTRHNIKRNDK